MKYLFYVILVIFLTGFSTSYTTTPEQDIEIAYKNALKGVQWAFENVPVKKETLSQDIIVNDQNICSVKLSKEHQGIKVIATGFCNSTSLEITTYKSFSEIKN